MRTYKLAITTGDKKGIGKELVKKALDVLKIPKDEIIIIGEKIEDLYFDYDVMEIDEENNGTFCYESLCMAISLAKEGFVKGIVTSPVSKSELHKSGRPFDGQTEILEYLFDKDSKKAQMLFIADDLRVMLLTRHLALKNISLSIEEVVSRIKILNDFLVDKCGIKNPKIALCAFNPHAGEDGYLGSEEKEILKPAVSILKRDENIDITNPISADALFAKIGREYLNNEPLSYDCIVANYHDQGLCPIKALAFDKAVNTTIGLNVIRTSPSSGTAYDIAGKNLANPESMIRAIALAQRLC